MYDASQFGQLNRLTWEFGIYIPISHRNQLGSGCGASTLTKLMVVRRIIRTYKSPFYLQAAREQPVTLALLPVESCEML
jgi:hypothetical protein